MINFYKYQGTGNDFILIDHTTEQLVKDKKNFALQWCNRRFGIGSDGIIFIEQSKKAAFFVDFYNPDGSKSFCGNGSRCAVKFAKDIGLFTENTILFEAIDGIHRAEISEKSIRIKMADVNTIEEIDNDYFIHTGSPHFISYENNLLRNIIEYGKTIRYSDQYKPLGTNVNLVEEIQSNHIRIRTYERGVEDETFSCGTGATACALSYAYKHQLNSGCIRTDVKGGTLMVSFLNNKNLFTEIWLEGPAVYVFKGIINDNIN